MPARTDVRWTPRVDHIAVLRFQLTMKKTPKGGGGLKLQSPKSWFAGIAKAMSSKHKKKKGSKFKGSTPKGQTPKDAADSPEERFEPLSDTVINNLTLTMSYVTTNFATTEGLYRVPGKKESVEALTKSLVQHPISASVLDGYEATDICDAIKAALHKCEPLFPFTMYDQLMLYNNPDKDLPKLKKILKREMPAANYRLFCHLVLHFRVLIDAGTQATATSYSRTGIGLALLRPRVMKATALHQITKVYMARNKFFETLLDNHTEILPAKLVSEVNQEAMRDKLRSCIDKLLVNHVAAEAQNGHSKSLSVQDIYSHVDKELGVRAGTICRREWGTSDGNAGDSSTSAAAGANGQTPHHWIAKYVENKIQDLIEEYDVTDDSATFDDDLSAIASKRPAPIDTSFVGDQSPPASVRGPSSTPNVDSDGFPAPTPPPRVSKQEASKKKSAALEGDAPKLQQASGRWHHLAAVVNAKDEKPWEKDPDNWDNAPSDDSDSSFVDAQQEPPEGYSPDRNANTANANPQASTASSRAHPVVGAESPVHAAIDREHEKQAIRYAASEKKRHKKRSTGRHQDGWDSVSSSDSSIEIDADAVNSSSDDDAETERRIARRLNAQSKHLIQVRYDLQLCGGDMLHVDNKPH